MLGCGDSICGGYIIGVLSARELRESQGAGGEPRELAASSGADADQAPSALQLRVRLLEMSSVFAELPDGSLRALARRMRAVPLSTGETLTLGAQGGDAMVFLASGRAEQSIADMSGKVLLTRRALPGDVLILPAPRTGTRFVTNIRGLTDAMILTLDQDSLMQGLGADVEKVAVALEKLWEQEVAFAAATEAQAATRSGGPIVAFFSAKGGSGVSTLAVNTAAALANKYPHQVLLVDLSAPFGHAALLADLVTTGSIAGASRASPADFDKALRGAVVYHRSGLGVLPGTLRPEQIDLMTGDLTGRALEAVAAGQRVVVADLGTALSEAALAVIERAQCLVVVMPAEIAAITDAKRSLAVFRDIMSVPDNRIELVLNHRVPQPPLDRGAVESILGRKMSVTVAFDDSRPEEATLAGGLVLQRDPSSQVSRGAAELARTIAGKLKLDG